MAKPTGPVIRWKEVLEVVDHGPLVDAIPWEDIIKKHGIANAIEKIGIENVTNAIGLESWFTRLTPEQRQALVELQRKAGDKTDP